MLSPHKVPRKKKKKSQKNTEPLFFVDKKPIEDQNVRLTWTQLRESNEKTMEDIPKVMPILTLKDWNVFDVKSDEMLKQSLQPGIEEKLYLEPKYFNWDPTVDELGFEFGYQGYQTEVVNRAMTKSKLKSYLLEKEYAVPKPLSVNQRKKRARMEVFFCWWVDGREKKLLGLSGMVCRSLR